jgi:disulfide bond formation protein DsbB
MEAMSPAAAIRFFSLLSLVAGAGAIAVVVMRLVPALRPALGALRDAAVWLAFAVAATATLGSLYFSEVRDLVPCRLCWFQRIFMYPLAIVLLVGAIRRDRGVRRYAVPLATIGLLVSAYHYFIEWNPQFESDSCAVSVPCSVPYFREFGFVSLAFMALCGFAAVLALLSIPSQESRHDEHESEAAVAG